MAETWIDSKTNQVRIRGQVDDAELAEVAISAGYINKFGQSLYEVIDEIQKELPRDFLVVTSKTAPEGSIRIGQVKVHKGDPEFPLYIVRRMGQRGRPPLFGERMVQTAIWLPEEQLAWLKKQGNVSEKVRELISKAMAE